MSCVKYRRGRWVVDFRDATGRRRWESYADRESANTRLSEILKGRGVIPTTLKCGFEEYATRWLESYVKAHCKASTYWEYESLLRNHLIPAFGAVGFTKINREMVRGLVAQKVAAGLSRSHVRNIIVPLREMFNHAIDDGLSIPNPAARVGRFNYRRGDSKRVDPLTREEVTLLLTTTREKLPDSYPCLPLGRVRVLVR
jgi:integrase